MHSVEGVPSAGGAMVSASLCLSRPARVGDVCGTASLRVEPCVFPPCSLSGGAIPSWLARLSRLRILDVGDAGIEWEFDGV